MVPSSTTRDLMLGLGIPAERITLTPFTVDNDWWFDKSAKVDRNATRTSWGAKPDTRVVLYCAKLQPWKRPMDLLRAFAQANLADTLLVIAGEGPLRGRLAAEARTLGVAERIRFLGFVNQSELPAIYTSADLMVLPSEYEPFAVVVNEAACCGSAVAASDRVGAARDLIAPVNPELIYPCGDLERLTELLRGALADPRRLAERGRLAREHMKSWSPARNISAVLEAVRLATERMGREPHAVVSDKAGKEGLGRWSGGQIP
jgi:glycosyltransferase involved in cell wall biosynthesis